MVYWRGGLVTETFKVLAQGSAAIGTTTLYTVPASTSAIFKLISVIPNVAGNPTTVKLTAAGRSIVPPIPLQTGEWVEWESSLALGAGSVLALILTGDTAEYVVTGLEITP